MLCAPLQGVLTTPGSGKRRVGREAGHRSRPGPSPDPDTLAEAIMTTCCAPPLERPLEAGTTTTSLYKLGIFGFAVSQARPSPKGREQDARSRSPTPTQKSQAACVGTLATRLWKSFLASDGSAFPICEIGWRPPHRVIKGLLRPLGQSLTLPSRLSVGHC